jgi:very-short-patch-repair endonuclease
MKDRISFARDLRHHPTAAERKFWVLLGPWRETGWHWRRQAPIGPYVVDFACKRIGLVIEIDGDSHFVGPGPDHDARRTAYLATRGYRVLRFTNDDALTADLHDVLVGILGEPGD